ncbi:MAG: hypothetical protein ACLSB9_20715 [Hydrogeniiclostridium mannosilyticum]
MPTLVELTKAMGIDVFSRATAGWLYSPLPRIFNKEWIIRLQLPDDSDTWAD